MRDIYGIGFTREKSIWEKEYNDLIFWFGQEDGFL